MPGPRPTRTLLRRLLALAAFVGALWTLQAVNWVTGYRLNPAFGLIPRQLAGLDGVIGMPLLHGSFAHLASNTPPLLVMGALLAATATRALIAVNAVIVGMGGALVGLLGGTAVHVGASGLVFGWFGFLVARGLVDRSPVTLAAALLVGALYGATIWGVLPGRPGISWEAPPLRGARGRGGGRPDPHAGPRPPDARGRAKVGRSDPTGARARRHGGVDGTEVVRRWRRRAGRTVLVVRACPVRRCTHCLAITVSALFR